MDPERQLASGLQQLNIQADDKQLSLLMQYVQLLQKWNKAYNLTSIERTEEIISKHILDSLSVAEHLKGKNIIDVGSGAGLPGIPLAIICADSQFTLLIDLGLKNVQVTHLRVQDFQATCEFSSLVSRAFAASDKLFVSCEQVLKHLSKEGRIIFMLGKQKHLEALPNGYNVEETHSIEIPNLEAQRHITIVERTHSK